MYTAMLMFMSQVTALLKLILYILIHLIDPKLGNAAVSKHAHTIKKKYTNMYKNIQYYVQMSKEKSL